MKIRARDRERIRPIVAALLGTYTASRFEHESGTRNVLRAIYCLKGLKWQVANRIATEIVLQGLDDIRAVRPSYAEGQPGYVDSCNTRFDCQHCNRPILNDHHRQYCSKTCAQAAWNARRTGRTEAQRRADEAKARAERFAPRPCGWCGTEFVPRPKTHGIYCSRECGCRAAAAIRHGIAAE